MLTEIINYICLSWFVLNFEPFQNILAGKTPNFNLKNIFTCCKCLTFWLTLLLTLDVYTSATCSCIAWIIFERLLTQLPYKL